MIITESDGFTLVREGGPVTAGGTLLVDRYSSAWPRPRRHGLRHGLGRLLIAGGAGPRARTCLLTRPAGSPVPADGDTILVATGGTEPGFAAFYRMINLDGVATWVPNRALVLVFDAGNWGVDQSVWVTAVDDLAAEGDAS